MKNYYTLIFTTITVLLFIVCCSSEQKFDSNKWKQKGIDWQMNDVRENMVNNLLYSDTLIGLANKEVIELLGEPETKKSYQYDYLIREKYEWDIDPEYIYLTS